MSTNLDTPDDPLQHAQDPAADLASDAWEAQDIANHAAVFGTLSSGYFETRQLQAAADQARAGLSPVLRARVATYEAALPVSRSITLPELRWLEHLATQETDAADTADAAGEVDEL